MSSSINVKEIGYAFLKTYYQRMHNDPSKAHHLYSATAELTHVNYQVDADYNHDTLPTIKLIGKENINKYYTRHSKRVTTVKVKVESCDFQFTGANNSSILILAIGEMCWSDTPTYRFCQTFILTPATSNPKIYDVTNDIIRFIPDIVYSTEQIENKHLTEESYQPNVEESQGEKNHERESTDQYDTSLAEPAAVESTSQTIKNENKTSEEESSSESEKPSLEKPDNQLHDSIHQTGASIPEQTKNSVQSIPDDEEDSHLSHHSSDTTESYENIGDKSQSTDQLDEPPKKMNWASKIANSDSKEVPNITTKYIRAEPQPAQQTKKSSERKSTSPTGQLKEAKNFKKKVFNFVNKDGFFPVYVRGTGGVSDEQLVRALESEFGVIKKISSQETFAVIDFEDQRCQTEAIERGILRINNVDVHMEPKTLRKSTASSSPSPSGQRFGRKHINKKKN